MHQLINHVKLFEVLPLTQIFRTTISAPGIYDSLFGGIFLSLGGPMMAQAALLTTVPLSILFATLNYRKLCQIFSLLSFLLICFFLLQPWDELFVNLRHSLNFARSGTFSFNSRSSIEGTVDFLPYFAIGVLGKLGLPLVELAFIQSILAGAGCIWAGSRILRHSGAKGSETWAVLFLSLYAPLAFNSANGFAATTLSFFLLLAIDELLFSDNRIMAILLLSLLPLIRIEALLASLLLGFYFVRRPLPLLLMLLPTGALTYWRFIKFGSIFPCPILFKASTFHLFYLVVGLRNFLSDLVNGGALAALIAVVLSLHESNKKWSIKTRHLLHATLLVLLFTLPYYSSGGDWLPRYWGRYLLPLSLISTLAAWTFLSQLLTTAPSHRFWKIVVVTLVCFVTQLPWFFSAPRKMVEDIFTHKKAMANAYSKQTGARHHRVQHLSQLGWHLSRTTPQRAVIASSEVATIMFYAEREALDLLGVSNPKIASLPSRLPPTILRPVGIYNELPYLIFRRVDPQMVQRLKPDILYTFDFFMRDLMPEVPFAEWTDSNLKIALQRWEEKFKGLNGPLYGGVEQILSWGYVPFVIVYQNEFCSLYFVSQDARRAHELTLRSLGFRTAKDSAS